MFIIQVPIYCSFKLKSFISGKHCSPRITCLPVKILYIDLYYFQLILDAPGSLANN